MKRDYSIDTLRTIATMLVIFLHVSANYSGAGFENNFDFNYWIGNIVNSFSRICVPLFLLISGRFLVGRTESFKVSYKKRASRILIPLITWSIFYLIYRLLIGYYGSGNLEFASLLRSVIFGIPYFHMWYLYMLLGLYLFIPVLNYSIANITRKTLWRVAILSMLFGVFLHFYNFYLDNNPFFLLWFVQYLGYFLLGYLIKDMRKDIPILLLIVTYLFSSLLIALLSYYTKIRFDNLYFYGYVTPLVIIASLSIYKVFCQITFHKNVLSNIAYLSFGIYLIHPVILGVFIKLLNIWNITVLNNSLIGISVKFVIVFSLSLLFSFGIYRVKVLRRTI